MIHFKPPLFQQLDHPGFKKRNLNVRVWRMDAIHPYISGNKWMKLQPWLQQAKSLGNTGIVTMGGPWSNHIHAAAYTAKTENLSFSAIITAKNGFMTPMLEEARKWGGRIIYAEKKDQQEPSRWEQLARNTNSIFIPMGGEGPCGITGVKDYINKLTLPSADHILCPVGTGTTFKGIAASKANYQTLTGINPGINDPGYELMVRALSGANPGKTYHLLGNPLLKKFGKWPALLPVKMNEWYRQWQLPTDIVYTAKMFFIFMELVNSTYFPEGSAILLVHTGGLQGNRSLPEGLLIY